MTTYSNEEKEDISKILLEELNQPLYVKKDGKILRLLPKINKFLYNDKDQKVHLYLEKELCYERTHTILKYYYDTYGLDYILSNTWADDKIKNLDLNDDFYEEKKRHYEHIKLAYSKVI